MKEKRKLNAVLLFFISQIFYGQDSRNWPSSLNYFKYGTNAVSIQICAGNEVKHREIVSEIEGKEYYCSGNLHATGPLKIGKTLIFIDSSKKIKYTEYLRAGFWKVYFDSTKQILRSQGNYLNGETDGKWFIYSISGAPTFEFEFNRGIIKKEIEIDEKGKRHSIIERTDISVFLERKKTLLILIAIFPIVLFRIVWNILTYNKIYQTNYTPGVQNWQTGGYSVNLYCTFLFWWKILDNDPEIVKKYKKIGNWISISSVICFLAFMIVYTLYGN